MKIGKPELNGERNRDVGSKLCRGIGVELVLLVIVNLISLLFKLELLL